MTRRRYRRPTSTREKAPSHTPPDIRYAPAADIVRYLGWFSIALGFAEMLAPRSVARLTGIRRANLVRSYGLREIATGVGVLAQFRPTGWIWARVAGDVLDLVTLAAGMAGATREERRRTRTAALAVTGVMAIDVICAKRLTDAAKQTG